LADQSHVTILNQSECFNFRRTQVYAEFFFTYSTEPWKKFESNTCLIASIKLPSTTGNFSQYHLSLDRTRYNAQSVLDFTIKVAFDLDPWPILIPQVSK